MTFRGCALLASVVVVLLASFTAGRMSKPGRVVEVKTDSDATLTKLAEARTSLATINARLDAATHELEDVRTHSVSQEVIAPGGIHYITRWKDRDSHKEAGAETHAATQAMAAATATKAAETSHISTHESTRIVEQARPSWSVGGSVGLGLDLKPRYGAEVGRRVWGGLWVTAGADISGRAALVGLRAEF